MKLKAFLEQREADWQRLEQILDALDARRSRKGAPLEGQDELPALYRRVCNDLAIAQDRMYGLRLCQRINRLVKRGYRHLHAPHPMRMDTVIRFFAFEFPALVRKNVGLFWLCTACFALPFGLMIYSGYQDPGWIHSVIGPDGMSQAEEMYGHDRSIDKMRRDGSSDLAMFAFYINNNIGIDFRTFASGIFFGIGSLFYLFFNGVYLGAFTGHVHQAASMENFYSFTSGHSSPELLGMVISGMAGLKMGLALFRPGQRTRIESLKFHTAEGVQLLYGAASMTFVAAIIEGFWSPLAMLAPIKYFVGILGWLLFTWYFCMAGRRHAA